MIRFTKNVSLRARPTFSSVFPFSAHLPLCLKMRIRHAQPSSPSGTSHVAPLALLSPLMDSAIEFVGWEISVSCHTAPNSPSSSSYQRLQLPVTSFRQSHLHTQAWDVLISKRLSLLPVGRVMVGLFFPVQGPQLDGWGLIIQISLPSCLRTLLLLLVMKNTQTPRLLFLLGP